MGKLQARVTAILTKPAEEWRVIGAETTDVAGLLRDYAAPLSALAALCRFIGLSLVGVTTFFGTIRVGVTQNIAAAIVAWVFGLVAAWLAAVVIERLAPTFQSKGSTTAALKLVVYSMTPVWVAGVLNLVPALAPLVLLAALYAIYIFYLGLPVLMNTPQDKIVPYMVVSALAVIVVTVVLGAISAALAGAGTYSVL